MRKKQTSASAYCSGKYLIASLFIISGILLLARNLEWITLELYCILMSWQMSLMIIGLYAMFRRYVFRGLALFLIGGCFLIPKLDLVWLPVDVGSLIWPVVLIVVGLSFFARSHRKADWKKKLEEQYTNSQYDSTDGFVRSDNTFGGVRQVVLDETFKGATLRNTFGGIVIDLRRTHIELGETYIDLDCNFGGIEIYVPSDWKVNIISNAFLGACEDKRIQGLSVDQSRVLVIRGNISFGGVEIKS